MISEGPKMTVLIQMIILVIFTTVFAGIRGQTYTYGSSPSSWNSVKRVCECSGNIAILDTAEKQTRLLDSGIIPAGKCAWIGASTFTSGQYKLIELPPNYDQGLANGQLLTDTYNNFLQGSVPERSGGWPAVCMFPNGTWVGTTNNNNGGHVCEWNECGLGMYKGKKTVSSNVYCSNQVDACLLCSGNKIKTLPGDNSTLCLDVCDGTTNVPNAAHTACECNSGYYGIGADCSPCFGNMVKPDQGDGESCGTECDPAASTPNSEHTDCVCNAGYYRVGSACVMCADNKIKTSAGNELHCDTDQPCDGVSMVPNENHTACECNAGYYGTVSSSCTLCPDNTIKAEQGDAAKCDVECVKSTEPNDEHTECVCFAGYYKSGQNCVMCTGNTIKMKAGNETNCHVVCGGTSIPNGNHTACVCMTGHKMLADGSCSKQKSVTYNLKQRHVEITSDVLISVQVASVRRCGIECAMRNCEVFSFHLLTPGVGICNMIMTKNVTYQPLEGAEYYTKP